MHANQAVQFKPHEHACPIKKSCNVVCNICCLSGVECNLRCRCKLAPGENGDTVVRIAVATATAAAPNRSTSHIVGINYVAHVNGRDGQHTAQKCGLTGLSIGHACGQAKAPTHDHIAKVYTTR